MPKARGTEHPCSGCGQIVAYRFPHQYQGNNRRGGGKPRVSHKCPHGEACIFGKGPSFGMGFNWPTCSECRMARRAEYLVRRVAR